MSRPTVILFALVAISAASPTDPDQAVRDGVAAFAEGNLQSAERYFEAAATRTTDPGLVAFNRAAIAARRGAWRTAELGYLQALDDADCPPHRRAEATFNRGVCLLNRGGPAAVYRTAIDLFTQAAELLGNDPLAADARHNLELAKRLWAEARRQEKTPPNPGDRSPDLPESPPSPGGGSVGGEPESGLAQQGSRPTKDGTLARSVSGQTGEATAGAGTLPVLIDRDAPQPLSPADTRAILGVTADRLARDRKANARLLAGPERPNVRDW